MKTDGIDFFLKEYNESNWRSYANCFSSIKAPDDLCKDIPLDIVYVLAGLLGVNSMKKWVRKELRHLDSETVEALVTTERGTKALKAFIMRMPN